MFASVTVANGPAVGMTQVRVLRLSGLLPAVVRPMDLWPLRAFRTKAARGDDLSLTVCIVSPVHIDLCQHARDRQCSCLRSIWDVAHAETEY